MISKEIKKHFLEYCINIRSQKVKENNVRVLTNAIETKQLNDEEFCWAYWNISDSLAMLRKPYEQYVNHGLFDKQLLNMDEKYLHWLTSDGTQKNNLYIGGYQTFWNDRYKYACLKSPKLTKNQNVRFESHRATVSFAAANDEYIFDGDIAWFALENMRTMLDDELSSNYNYEFYKITYYTQLINFNTKLHIPINQNILDKSYETYTSLLCLLQFDRNEPDENTGNKIYLLGSWQQLNGKRAKFNQASVGTKNYIITLINASKYEMALDCYLKIKPYGLKHNDYFNNKIEFAKKQLLY